MPDPHPFAAMFPALDPTAFDALVADISENGLRHPIVLDAQGRVLDGRNRLRACEEAGVDPVFETYSGDDPEGFILSNNVHRRHITPSQRAAVIALQYKLGGLKRTVKKLIGKQGDSAREVMASMAGVSQGTIQTAQYIANKGGKDAREYLEQCVAGTMTLTRAKKLIDGPDEDKPTLLSRTAIVEGLSDILDGFAARAEEDPPDDLFTAVVDLYKECVPAEDPVAA